MIGILVALFAFFTSFTVGIGLILPWAVNNSQLPAWANVIIVSIVIFGMSYMIFFVYEFITALIEELVKVTDKVKDELDKKTGKENQD